jgi:hypothetical protein
MTTSVACTTEKDTLKPAEAISHVGELATVCGNVASTNYAASTRRKATFINLGSPYPEHVFTALNLGEGPPSLRGTRVGLQEQATVRDWHGGDVS